MFIYQLIGKSVKISPDVGRIRCRRFAVYPHFIRICDIMPPGGRSIMFSPANGGAVIL